MSSRILKITVAVTEKELRKFICGRLSSVTDPNKRLITSPKAIAAAHAGDDRIMSLEEIKQILDSIHNYRLFLSLQDSQLDDIQQILAQYLDGLIQEETAKRDPDGPSTMREMTEEEAAVMAAGVQLR